MLGVPVSLAKADGPIELPLGVWQTSIGPKNRVAYWMAGAHWRHLANMIERCVRDGDAALCQITLTPQRCAKAMPISYGPVSVCHVGVISKWLDRLIRVFGVETLFDLSYAV